MIVETVGDTAAPLLADLHARAFAQPWSQKQIAQMLQNPAAFAALARDDASAACGFALAWAAAGESELLTLAVVPEARRRGVGAALVTAACAAALARGARAMHLEVAEDNAPARALYAKLGYAEVGRRIGYYARASGAADAVVMRRALPDGAL